MKKQTITSAIRHLRKEEKMSMLIERYGMPVFNNSIDYFSALSKSIIFQQLSGKAAGTIYNRFLNLFEDKSPTSEIIAEIDTSILKTIGLSNQKSEYIVGLAEYFSNEGKEVDFQSLSNDEVNKKLIELKGIGPWTIEMFLMFTLNREDILPVTDLGIMKGFRQLYNLNDLPSVKYMNKQAQPWKPYRTLASWYLWKIVDDGGDGW